MLLFWSFFEDLSRSTIQEITVEETIRYIEHNKVRLALDSDGSWQTFRNAIQTCWFFWKNLWKDVKIFRNLSVNIV